MKTSGCLASLLFVVLIFAFVVLFLLDGIMPDELKIDYMPEPAGAALRQFNKIENGTEYVVSYGFVDYMSKAHHISCGIRKSDHQREVETFGYDYEEIKKLGDAELQTIFNAEIRSLGFAPFLTIQFYGGGGYKWKYSIPSGDAAWQDKIEKDIKQYVAGLSDRVDSRYESIKQSLFRPRGFQLRNQTIHLDYTTLVDWGVDPLRHCFHQLFEKGRGYSERDLIGLYLAFFQEIKYEVPPSKIGNKSIQGLWVPTEVVANNHGDCDSKSVAFASMLKNLGLRSIIILIDDPNHALVGVEGKPGPDDHFVRAGNRYFILCEVAGPGKYRPGREGFPVKGAFEYQAIEP